MPATLVGPLVRVMLLLLLAILGSGVSAAEGETQQQQPCSVSFTSMYVDQMIGWIMSFVQVGALVALSYQIFLNVQEGRQQPSLANSGATIR